MRLKLFFLVLILSHICSNAQVNLQTGAAQLSIPLYSYSDANNRIGTSVSIAYIAGNGLKTSDIPSSVGSGWDLAAGGVISRIQHGEPDDQLNALYPWNTNITGNNLNANYYPNGYLYSEYNPLDLVNNGASFLPHGPGTFDIDKKYQADRELDMFSFSFNGRSGEFFFDKNGNIRTVVDSKLKIEKVESDMTLSNIRTRISQFKITDETGIQYIFSDLELNQVVVYDDIYNTVYYYPDGSHKRTTKLAKARPINQYVVSKWFLTKIINSLTNTEIHFNYETYSIDMDGEKTMEKSLSPNGDENENMLVSKIKATGKRLLSIDCSPKERVEFSYLGNRYDLPFDKILDQVSIKYDNQIVLYYKLSHEYFFLNNLYPLDEGLNNVEKHQTRLSLKSIQKFGSNDKSEPPYQFTYNLGDPNIDTDVVPPIFSVYHDHYGYFNLSVWGFRPWYESNYSDGSTSGLGSAYPPLSTIVGNPVQYRGIAPGQGKTGTLKSVQYPAGGSFSFDYEQNYAMDAWDLRIVGGLHVSKTTSYDGINHSNDIVTEYKYVLDDNTTTSGWGYEYLQYSRTSTFEVHRCGDETSVMTPRIPGEPSFSFSWSSAHIVGISPPQTIFDEIIATIIRMFTDPVKTYNTPDSYSYPINGHNVLPIQFSRVQASSKIGTSSNGTTIYEFTSKDDLPIYNSAWGWPFSSETKYAYWAYGLPKKITTKDKLDNPVKMIENHYSFDQPFTQVLLTQNEYASQKWSPNVTVTDCITQWPNYMSTTGAQNIAHRIYYPLTGRVQLQSTDVHEYVGGSQKSLVTTNYYYNADYQVRKIETNNSKGELTEKNIYYPDDYTLTGAIQNLKDNHIIGVPISSQSFITKSGTKYLLSGNVFEFGNTTNGDIKPIHTYSFESNLPVDNSLVAFSSTQLVPSNYYRQTSSIEYNSDGIPANSSSDVGKVCSIYDYENKLPTASISNASIAEVGYTSFEAENKGNWNYDEQNIRTDFAPTGKKYYTINPNSCIGYTNGLNSSKKYIVSFWAKGGTISLTKISGNPPNQFYLNAGALIKSYTNPATGWTYYEYELSNSSNLTIDNGCLRIVQGYTYPTILIDELRLYPSTARVFTTTYDPLIGKTSECGTNGRITYYQYDGLGKLKLVLDENRNVLKAYEYNYGPKTFYNAYKSVPFQKNCSAPGYEGSIVNYVVPYGKYSSTISQPDADQQADNEVNLYGQSNADAQGSCYLTQTVYALVSYENVWSSGSETYADIVVRFYSDANYATPFTVYDYDLTYNVSNTCTNSTNFYATTVTGNQVTIAYGAQIYYTDYVWDPYWGTWVTQDCFIDYYL